MPLRHLLYRCPMCGQDPTVGKGDHAACPSCGAKFHRARRGIRVAREAATQVVPVADLVDQIRAFGGPLTAAQHADGTTRYSADVLYRGFVTEEPVWKAGRLLGYMERPQAPRAGHLTVTGEALSFRSAATDEAAFEVRWPLGEVTSLQVSTGSLQMGIRRAGTVQFKLLSASTYRWEELLQALIRRHWSETGRGTITEFQPRITGR